MLKRSAQIGVTQPGSGTQEGVPDDPMHYILPSLLIANLCGVRVRLGLCLLGETGTLFKRLWRLVIPICPMSRPLSVIRITGKGKAQFFSTFFDLGRCLAADAGNQAQ